MTFKPTRSINSDVRRACTTQENITIFDELIFQRLMGTRNPAVAEMPRDASSVSS